MPDEKRHESEDLEDYEVEDPYDTLDGTLGDDPLDRGVATPDRWSAGIRFGTTAEEQDEGESLDQLLAEEEPDTPLDADYRRPQDVAADEDEDDDEDEDEDDEDAGPRPRRPHPRPRRRPHPRRRRRPAAVCSPRPRGCRVPLRRAAGRGTPPRPVPLRWCRTVSRPTTGPAWRRRGPGDRRRAFRPACRKGLRPRSLQDLPTRGASRRASADSSRPGTVVTLRRPADLHRGGAMDKLLPGVTSERVDTDRLTVAVLSVTERDGQAVLFVHGNVSSSLFWQPTMLALPEGYRPLAIDLRGFGDTDPEPVN